ncbi:MAG: HNH endonuclease signature motif containing protein [Alphaproteobacteria bacterium]
MLILGPRPDPVEIPDRKSLTPKQRLEVLLAFNGRCAKCREKIAGAFEVDHVKARGLGGLNDLSNYEPLHPACHAGKTPGDVRRIAKAKRQAKACVPRDPDEPRKASTLKGRGFNKNMTKGLDGKVKPRRTRKTKTV